MFLTDVYSVFFRVNKSLVCRTLNLLQTRACSLFTVIAPELFPSESILFRWKFYSAGKNSIAITVLFSL